MQNTAATNYGQGTNTGVGGIGQPAGYGNTGLATESHHHDHHHKGVGGGFTSDVCDPPLVYKAGPEAAKTVRHVQDDGRERVYEAPVVEETIVHHDVERIKPVIHTEVHQTRLHERTHHKVEAPRDLGITEVVQHRDTDPCGNLLTEDLNAVRGGTTGIKGMIENAADRLTGHHTGHTGATGLTGHTGATGVGHQGEYGTTGYRNDKFATGGTTTAPAPAGPADGIGYGTTGAAGYDNVGTGVGTGVGTTTGYDKVGTGAGTATPSGYGTTDTYSNTATTGTAATPHEPGGIKGLINKVIPGPGPFKPVV